MPEEFSENEDQSIQQFIEVYQYSQWDNKFFIIKISILLALSVFVGTIVSHLATNHKSTFGIGSSAFLFGIGNLAYGSILEAERLKEER